VGQAVQTTLLGMQRVANRYACGPMSIFFTAALLVIGSTLGAQGTASPTPPNPPSQAAPSSPPVDVRGANDPQGTLQGGANGPARLSQRTRNDVLYPGDIVRLKIWREPDLSGDYEVNDQGMAVFPKVGGIHVSEITTDSLQRLLLNTYAAFLRDPAIEVTPLRRVTVLGAVKNPGLYPIDPTMSIADALALAGGPTPDGNQKKLELIRGGKKQNVTITVHQQIAQTAIRSGDELYVPERSWLSRNGYVIGAAIGAATVIATTILTHR
jgi:protein involved in polysaccharide export with SLBB domain